jgi:asparagine synthase (glutamine-hydrolysing)
MCGIVGFVGKSKEAKKIIDSMNNKLIHRGPDDFGTYIDEVCALGHRRLAIIDLKTGKQPITDGNYTIVFNGEIYNFLELKEELKKKYKFNTKTDTEVILKGYEEWGTDVTKKLRGMFAFAIWDKKKKELFLARDQWGIKPLYYYKNNGTFMFSSEIKAFMEHPDFVKEFNGDILSAYLCFNSVPTEESFFKGVFKLKPGHFLLYKDGEFKIERFFKLEFDETKQNEEELVKKIQNAMVDSVEHHKIADVEVGSFLSSGVDSSYVVSLLKPNKTFTASFDQKYSRYDEIKYAKDLSDKLGIENKSYIITKEEYLKEFPKIMYYMDEPLADPSAIALYFVAKEASKYVKVVTSGEGADELFCGYGDYREEVDHAWYNKIPYPIRHLISIPFSHYKFQEIKGINFLYRKGQKLENYFIGDGKVYTDGEANKIVKLKNQIKTKDITKPYYEEYKDSSNTVKRQVIDFYFWLVNDYLTAVDRNTMIFSLEARTPFLDKEVFKVASTLALEEKVNKETTKVALRKAAKDVIPNTNYKKPKLGFPVPLREWIREDELYNEIKEKFNSKIAEKYFDQNYIINLLDKHKNGRVDCFKKVWTVYTFIIWYEQYFGEEA